MYSHSRQSLALGGLLALVFGLPLFSWGFGPAQAASPAAPPLSNLTPLHTPPPAETAIVIPPPEDTATPAATDPTPTLGAETPTPEFVTEVTTKISIDTPTATSPRVDPVESATPWPTPTFFDPPTLEARPSATAAPTDTHTPTPTPTLWLAPPLAPQDVVINEVAWAGTAASTSDEWLELHNTTGMPIDLSGWTLSDGGDIAITLNGTVGAGGYFLLERTDNTTISDIPADQIYTGGLANTGETLTLRDALGNSVDIANGNGGPWPAGSTAGFYSMERLGTGPDSDGNWCANDGVTRNGLDAAGNPLNATPHQANSGCASPTPTATGTFTVTVTPAPSGAVVINEVAWAGTVASTNDEWIELHNPGSTAIDLSGWLLSDGGDMAILLNGTVSAGGYFLLERTDDTTIGDIPADQTYTGGLNNTGETLTLYDALANVVDTANGNGGPWPAGNTAGFYSMERLGAGPDSDGNWCTNDGLTRNGQDAAGNPLNATPRQPNSSCTAPTPTATGTLTVTLTPAPPGAVIINEVAWAGTAASSSDEWIELHNPGSVAIDLSGWLLSDGGDINIALNGTVSAGGYFLLERTNDTTVSDIPADQIYVGGLSNAGEVLTLYDALANVVDTANGGGGPWPGGDDATRATLERLGTGPSWQTHNGYCRIGRDANGALLRATARAANSQTCPVPTQEPVPPGLLLNEFLPHPASGMEEFIEVINLTGAAFDLGGYQLDDAEGGSSPYVVPAGTVLQPGAIVAFAKGATGLIFNDDGDTARMLTPNGTLVDALTYADDPGTGHSWARLPDGGGWSDMGDPTPGGSNRALPAPTAMPIYPIGEVRQWSAGAWATIVGRVTVPPNVFSRRVVYIQDETGGIAVYLGRGDWPALKVGQQLKVFGYMRPRNGEAQLYVRNVWWVGAGPETDLVPVSPRPATTGEFGEPLEGWLVTMRGTVVKLEAQGFWLDDGSGAARVFFAAATGVKRPPVKRGEVWVITGVIVENTTASAAAPRYRLQIRFVSDYLKLTDAAGNSALTPTPVLNDVVENPTEEPTATAQP